MSKELEKTASLPPRITISPDILFQELDGEMVLLNPQNEHYYSLDDVGMRMWQLLAEHGEVTAVLKQLLAEFDVDEAGLRRDLANLISELVEAGLVTVDL